MKLPEEGLAVVALVHVTLLALLGLVAWLAARRGSPAFRSAVLLAALGGIVLVPLATTITPNVLGPGDPNVCSPDAEIVVPLRGGPGAYKHGKLTLRTDATAYSGDVDIDKIQLRCDP